MSLLASVAESQQTLYEFAGLPQGWLRPLALLLLVALAYGAWWLYRREARAGAGTLLRRSLAVTRIVVLVGLALIWLQPVRATYVSRTTPGRVIVLSDASASMDVADAVAGATRREPRSAQVARLLHADDHRWLRRLAADNELALYEFGETAVRRNLPWGGAPATAASAALPPGASARTDIGHALALALEEAAGSPLAGVVLLTDGETNKGMALEELIAYARRSRAPVYAVGVGEEREPPNLRVTNISAPAVAPRGDPFEVRVEVAGAGLDSAREVEVTLAAEPESQGDAPRTESVVATQRVALGDAPPDPLLFKVTPTAAGAFTYRARVEPLADEIVFEDNVRETSVLILDDSLRVLIVAGRPSYDYRFLTHMLERDKSVDLSCWLQSADERAIRDGDTVITELPRRSDQVFAYDAILLLDPNPAELDASWAATLHRFVDEFGGGLLLEAGPLFTTRFLGDARLGELVNILPVTPDPEAELRMSDQGTFRTRAFPFEVPPESRGHPLLALHSDPLESERAWQSLPGVWWHLPVAREKPLATVLLRHSAPAARTRFGPTPLFAVQPVGAGRVAFLGLDSTWRWRSANEASFNRFWVQTVRYLAQARRQGAGVRGTIILDRELINVGDFVKVEARVLDDKFVPWSEPQIEAFVESADRRAALRLEAIPGREGWFGGRVIFDREGPALVRVPLPGAAAPTSTQPDAGSLTKRVRVQRPDFEMRALRQRVEELRDLAAQTRGAYLPLRDAQRLPDMIQNASRIEPPRRAAAVDLWDRGWVLGLLATLLAVEWSIRRRNHLL